MEFLLILLVGISLSATSGFRLFVPLLALSVAALAGWVELSPAFAWMGTYPALAALLLATVLESAAYFFPYVDNLLAAIATPVGVAAGALITASLMVDLHPMLTWTLAVVAGGGAALGGSVVSNAVHAGSTATTGGAATPAVSLIESVLTVIASFLVVLVPLFAVLFVVVMAVLVIGIVKRLRKKRRHSRQVINS